MNSYESTSGIRDLKVMGARTQLGGAWASATHKLVALDKETLQPVSVDWWYEDESAPRFTGPVFTDTRPNVRLLANSDVYRLGDVINISNFGGSSSAFAVIKDDGTVEAWGSQNMVEPHQPASVTIMSGLFMAASTLLRLLIPMARYLPGLWMMITLCLIMLLHWMIF